MCVCFDDDDDDGDDDDDDESDRHAIEGGGCKGKCNYWQTGWTSNSSMMISYHILSYQNVMALQCIVANRKYACCLSVLETPRPIFGKFPNRGGGPKNLVADF